MKYSPKWDLSTIPEPVWNSEHGRRQRAKVPGTPNVKFKPCHKCGMNLTATQRRTPCPDCGWNNLVLKAGIGWLDNPYTEMEV